MHCWVLESRVNNLQKHQLQSQEFIDKIIRYDMYLLLEYLYCSYSYISIPIHALHKGCDNTKSEGGHQ